MVYVSGMNDEPTKILLTTKEVSDSTGIPVHTLHNWRTRRYGLPFIKFGESRSAKVRYTPEDIRRWIEEHRISPITSEAT